MCGGPLGLELKIRVVQRQQCINKFYKLHYRKLNFLSFNFFLHFDKNFNLWFLFCLTFEHCNRTWVALIWFHWTIVMKNMSRVFNQTIHYRNKSREEDKGYSLQLQGFFQNS
jgi:hypothetical protein